jgi:hypothetical protein
MQMSVVVEAIPENLFRPFALKCRIAIATPRRDEINAVELNRCAVGAAVFGFQAASWSRWGIIDRFSYKERSDDSTSTADDRGHAAAESLAAHD